MNRPSLPVPFRVSDADVSITSPSVRDARRDVAHNDVTSSSAARRSADGRQDAETQMKSGNLLAAATAVEKQGDWASSAASRLRRESIYQPPSRLFDWLENDPKLGGVEQLENLSKDELYFYTSAGYL